MVFYCERAAGFCSDVGYQDDGYFDALVRMSSSLKAMPSYLQATSMPYRRLNRYADQPRLRYG